MLSWFSLNLLWIELKVDYMCRYDIHLLLSRLTGPFVLTKVRAVPKTTITYLTFERFFTWKKKHLNSINFSGFSINTANIIETPEIEKKMLRFFFFRIQNSVPKQRMCLSFLRNTAVNPMISQRVFHKKLMLIHMLCLTSWPISHLNQRQGQNEIDVNTET